MKTLSTKVSAEMMERIEDYAEQMGETRSVATRELLYYGLERAENPHSVSGPTVLIYLGAVLAAPAFVEADPIVGYFGLAAIVVGLLLTRPRVQRLISSYSGSIPG